MELVSFPISLTLPWSMATSIVVVCGELRPACILVEILVLDRLIGELRSCCLPLTSRGGSINKAKLFYENWLLIAIVEVESFFLGVRVLIINP